VTPAGRVQTTFNPSDFIVNNTSVTGVDFGSFAQVTISGLAFDDRDGDGVRDAGEPGLGGINITLDVGGNGSVDATVPTDAGGNYSFTGLGPGLHRVRQVTPAGRVQTTTNPADFFTSSGGNVSGVDFGSFAQATISGQAFDDVDGDGVQDAGEPGLGAVTINLDIGADGSVDATVPTDAGGNYSFTGLGPGAYRVRQVTPAGRVQTTANPADFTAASGSNVTDVDFGSQLLPAPAAAEIPSLSRAGALVMLLLLGAAALLRLREII